MAEKIISALVQNFFYQDDDSNIPDGLVACDPAKFAQAIKKKFQKTKWGQRAVFNLCSVTPRMIAFLQRLDLARLKIKSSEFDEVLSTIKFSLDVGVIEGEHWEAKLFPNGSIAFRNSHRIIGVSGRPTASLEILNNELRSIICTLFSKMSHLEDIEITPLGFSILHHDDDGVHWTRKVPGLLSTTGQTLIFLPLNWAREWPDTDPTAKQILIDTAEKSRSGHAVIRTFEERIFVHGTSRQSDELDTIMENFSYYLGTMPDDNDPCKEPIFDHLGRLQNFVEHQIDFEKTDFYKIKRSLSSDFTAIIKAKLMEEFVIAKALQINALPQFFSQNCEKPVTLNDGLKHYEIGKLYNGNTIVFTFDLRIGRSLKSFKKTVIESISQKLEGYNLEGSKIAFSEEYTSETETQEYFDWGSDELSKRLDACRKELMAEYKLIDEDDTTEDNHQVEREMELLRNAEQVLDIIVFIKFDPNPIQIQRDALRLSSREISFRAVSIPKYGYFQSYYEGERDAGNESTLIPFEADIMDDGL